MIRSPAGVQTSLVPVLQDIKDKAAAKAARTGFRFIRLLVWSVGKVNNFDGDLCIIMVIFAEI